MSLTCEMTNNCFPRLVCLFPSPSPLYFFVFSLNENLDHAILYCVSYPQYGFLSCGSLIIWRTSEHKKCAEINPESPSKQVRWNVSSFGPGRTCWWWILGNPFWSSWKRYHWLYFDTRLHNSENEDAGSVSKWYNDHLDQIHIHKGINWINWSIDRSYSTERRNKND